MFHIETDGAVIINITAGSAGQRRPADNCHVDHPDDETRGGDGLGRVWHRVGDRIVCIEDVSTEDG